MSRLLLVVAWAVGLGAIGCSSNSSTKGSGAQATTGAGTSGKAGAAGVAAGRSATGGRSGGDAAGSAGVAASSGGMSAVDGGAVGDGAVGDGAVGDGTSGRAGSSGSKAGTGGSSGTGGAAMLDAGTATRDASAKDAQAADADMSTGRASDDDAGMVCMTPPGRFNLGTFSKCPASICPAQDSVCVQTSFLKQLDIPAASIDMLGNCDADNKCVPDVLAEVAGRITLPTCTSLNGAEGRCLSPCVPQVAKQASQLPKDTCTGTDLCAPCYDPRDGKATGACTQGCDKGPTQPAKTFAHCCSDRGFCVPPSLAGSLASNLLKDTCSTGLLCAPNALTDPTFKPKSCASLDGAEGRCLSTCLGGAVAQQADRLPTAGCGQDEVCAPCFDPITGKDTSACTINGDKPAQPPYRFPACCDNGAGTRVGVCVTPALAGSQASMLQQDTCASGRLCAPIKKAEDPNYKFKRCTGLGAGACVPSCILPAAEAGLLSRVNCATGEVCAPCAAFGLSSTGACD
jgi:hypothetical protein